MRRGWLVVFLAVLVLGGRDFGQPLTARAEAGVLAGRLLTAEGEVVPRAVMLFFDADHGPPPRPGDYWRLPDGGAPVDDSGSFRVSLPAGRYWYGAIKKSKERRGQQPKLENWLYLGREAGGGLATVQVHSGQTTTLAEIKGAGRVVAEGGDEAVEVRGTIKDGSGRPVTGLVVEVFARAGAQLRPLFSSDHLLADGSFTLNLPAGEYELQLRPLARQDSALRYRLTEPARIAVRAGQAAEPLALRVMVATE